MDSVKEVPGAEEWTYGKVSEHKPEVPVLRHSDDQRAEQVWAGTDVSLSVMKDEVEEERGGW